MKWKTLTIAIWLGVALLASCAARSSRIIYQTDPLQRLLAGGYHNGQSNLGEVKKLGDFGLGTFDDYKGGEMLILGGLIYSIPNPDNSFLVEDLSLKTPFAMTTKFLPTHHIQIKQIADYTALQKLLDEHFSPEKNYAILIRGLFHSLKVQAVEAPQEAGLPFEKIGQQKAELQDVSAELFGFRMGSSASSINHVGYHFHGRTRSGQGGHLLDLQSSEPITVQWQEASDVIVLHP